MHRMHRDCEYINRMRYTINLLLFLFICSSSFGSVTVLDTIMMIQGEDTTYTIIEPFEDGTEITVDEIEASFNYETGSIKLESGNATINVPEGFRYLNKTQANIVLEDLWGNPPDETVMGLLVPTDVGVMDEHGWVFTISFEEIGYVDDEDAEDIDYDELLEDQQKEFIEDNTYRISEGYDPIFFIGWASEPYYDNEKKVLHWAKEIQFGEEEGTNNTLNYNLRILGRKGVFVLNAVAQMVELERVKESIDIVLASVEFEEGHTYFDFDPEVDEVAVWTIGGLVAGKILAKIGFFAVILKFWKLLALAVVGLGGGIWKFFKGKKKGEVSINTRKQE